MNSNEGIVVSPYDPAWRTRYDAEETSLRAALSSNVAIEHIGSTSVVGLTAKPIVDIMIGVRSLADAPPMIGIIESLGYEYVPQFEREMPERRYFRKTNERGERTCHIHLVERDSPFWARHLYFRDRLRADKKLADEYANIKRKLAAEFGSDREGYTNAKTPFIMSIENEREATQKINTPAFAADFIARGDRTGWFEELYKTASGDQHRIPWADDVANPYLVEWLDRSTIVGAGKSAVVIACGLGDDAEELARRGFRVTAFDISETAIAWAKRRFPGSNVDYVVADLFKLPSDWEQRFDFIFECYTVQALPPDVRTETISAICSLLAPRGEMLMISRKWEGESLETGPPWALRDEDVALFCNDLTEISHEEFFDNTIGRQRLRCLFQRD